MATIATEVKGEKIEGDVKILVTDLTQRILSIGLGKGFFICQSKFHQFKVPKGVKLADKDAIWNMLMERGYLLEMDNDGARGSSYIPVQLMSKPFNSLFDDLEGEASLEFPETLSAAGLATYLLHAQGRAPNVAIMLEFLETAGLEIKKVKGRLSAARNALSEDFASRASKLRDQEKNSLELLDTLKTDQPPHRKLSKKTSIGSDDPENHTLPTRMITYRHTPPLSLATRKIANGVAAQSCSRRTLAVAAKHTVDLDIENCGPVLLRQMLDKLSPTVNPPADIREAIDQLADDRDGTIRSKLSVYTLDRAGG